MLQNPSNLIFFKLRPNLEKKKAISHIWKFVDLSKTCFLGCMQEETVVKMCWKFIYGIYYEDRTKVVIHSQRKSLQSYKNFQKPKFSISDQRISTPILHLEKCSTKFCSKICLANMEGVGFLGKPENVFKKGTLENHLTGTPGNVGKRSFSAATFPKHVFLIFTKICQTKREAPASLALFLGRMTASFSCSSYWALEECNEFVWQYCIAVVLPRR